MRRFRYMFAMLALMSIGCLLLEIEASPLKRISDFPGDSDEPLIPIGGEPDFSGLQAALLREPVDFGDFGSVGSLPVGNIGSAVSSASSVVAKADPGPGGGAVEVFVTLTAGTIAALTKSLFHWFGGKKSFDFLDTTCHQKTFPYINRLQLRYKSECHCNGYSVTGYGRSANRRKAADEATEDFLKKANEKKLFKKSVVDNWLKSNTVPTPAPKPATVTQKPKTWAEICG